MEGVLNATVALLPSPVGELLARTVLSAHPVHLAAELALLLFVIYLLFSAQYRHKSHRDDPLTAQEEEQLLAEWQPEPLLSSTAASAAAGAPTLRVVEGASGPLVKLEGIAQEAVNLAGTGVLGYQCHPAVVASALACTNEFGVGACGPRGFYGSIAPHLALEKRVAEFMRVEDSVMFSAEFQGPASVLPAFAKPGDIVVADKSVHFALQTGLQLSRADVRWFEPGSVADLRRVLDSLQDVFAARRLRVFVVLEGISANSGRLFALDQVMALKQRFPFRLVLDDSLAVGVLGATGRGSCEHFGVDPRQVEVILFSLGHALGSVGGMACASAMLCNHMRLNCTGYVFSCSSPPYVAQAAVAALDLLDAGAELPHLRRATATAHAALASLAPRLTCDSDALSPFLHLRLAPRYSTGRAADDMRLLAAIAEAALGLAAPAPAAAEETKPKRGRTPSKAKALKESKEKDDTAPEPAPADDTGLTRRGRGRRASAGAASVATVSLASAPASAPVLVGVAQYAPQEKFTPVPSLRVSVSALLDDETLQHAFASLDKAARAVLK